MPKKVIQFPAASINGLSKRRRAQFEAVGLLCDPRITLDDIEEVIEYLRSAIDSNKESPPCEVIGLKE